MTSSSERPPAGIEIKAAASMLAPRPGEAAPGVGSVAPEGVVELIAAVTGIEDEVNDIILPGAFERIAPTGLWPKLCLGHNWNQVIGRVLAVRELRPGDPGLPAVAGDGRPWPADAGALVVTAQLAMSSTGGREAYEVIKFFTPRECSFSIGYKVCAGGARTGPGGTRWITDLDVYEVSLVLHGANRYARGLSIKSADAALEYKATTGAAATALTGFESVDCSICGQTGGMLSGGLTRGQKLICSSCLDGHQEILTALARFGELNLTSEEEYTAAQRREQPWQLASDGTLRRDRGR